MTEAINPTEYPSILGSMPYEKAKAIMTEVLEVGFEALGFDNKENAKFPMQYSLEEICIAARLISVRNKGMNKPDGIERSFMMTMADRGIAAHYALAHYHNDPEALLQAIGFTLNDDDEE